MQALAESVSKFILEEGLLQAGDRVGLAVSGGADSVALLRAMLELRRELGVVLSVLHFNHKLRGADSEADEGFVREVSRHHGLDFFSASGDVPAHAKQKHLSLEAAARSLRYRFFGDGLRNARLNCIATAHTLDDQAETVLLKLVRGAGTRGLAGIYPKLAIERAVEDQLADYEAKYIVRPLLGIRRRDVELYLKGLGQNWREDKSNRDLRHSRNVVRHGILPRLARDLNPAIREALAETADIARAEEEYWNVRVAEIMPTVLRPSDAAGETDGAVILDAKLLLAHPLALQRRLIRAIAELLDFNLEFKHVEQVLKVVSDRNHSQAASLPGGWRAARNRNEIIFCPSAVADSDYEYRLSVPGRIEVPEAGRLIEAVLIRPGDESAYNRDQTIDPALVARELHVRNWRPGDRFWPGHSKSPKKIKELLQERHVAGTNRKRTPVVVSGDEVIWVEGFSVPMALRPQDSKQEVMVIRQTAI